MEEENNGHFGAWLVIAISLFIFFALVFSGGIFGSLSRPTTGAVQVAGSGGGLSILALWNSFFIPLFIVLDVILLGFIVFLWIKLQPYKPYYSIWQKPVATAKKAKATRDKEIVRFWARIAKLAKEGGQANIRLAILEADALVDFFLKKYSYEGETMADRLNQISDFDVPHMPLVWKAHRLRNDLAHTPGLGVSTHQAQESLTAFRDFLIHMGVL